MKLRRILCLGSLVLFPAEVCLGQASSTPPGVPEPGLLIWGTVVNAQAPNQAIAITSASWSVTDGSKTAVFTRDSRPPVRIVNEGTQSYYLVEVPFDTRSFGSITLSDPALADPPVQSFELKSVSPPTYTLVPTINGVPASVRAVDGAPALVTNNVAVSGFSSAVRGRMIRVDLAINPPTDTYETWARRYFPDLNHPNALPDADFDGDGLTNQQEYLAGTDPTDSKAALRVLSIELMEASTEVALQWQSVPNKTYRLSAAARAEGPYAEVGGTVPATGAATTASVPRASAEQERFYRIRVLP